MEKYLYSRKEAKDNTEKRKKITSTSDKISPLSHLQCRNFPTFLATISLLSRSDTLKSKTFSGTSRALTSKLREIASIYTKNRVKNPHKITLYDRVIILQDIEALIRTDGSLMMWLLYQFSTWWLCLPSIKLTTRWRKILFFIYNKENNWKSHWLTLYKPICALMTHLYHKVFVLQMLHFSYN